MLSSFGFNLCCLTVFYPSASACFSPLFSAGFNPLSPFLCFWPSLLSSRQGAVYMRPILVILFTIFYCLLDLYFHHFFTFPMHCISNKGQMFRLLLPISNFFGANDIYLIQVMQLDDPHSGDFPTSISKISCHISTSF